MLRVILCLNLDPFSSGTVTTCASMTTRRSTEQLRVEKPLVWHKSRTTSGPRIGCEWIRKYVTAPWGQITFNP
jgi:hypothetical protein